jgi:hypothetical protein
MLATLAWPARGDKDSLGMTPRGVFLGPNGRWETVQNEVSLKRWCAKCHCTTLEFGRRHEWVTVSLRLLEAFGVGSTSIAMLAR